MTLIVHPSHTQSQPPCPPPPSLTICSARRKRSAIQSPASPGDEPPRRRYRHPAGCTCETCQRRRPGDEAHGLDGMDGVDGVDGLEGLEEEMAAAGVVGDGLDDAADLLADLGSDDELPVRGPQQQQQQEGAVESKAASAAATSSAAAAAAAAALTKQKRPQKLPHQVGCSGGSSVPGSKCWACYVMITG